MTLIVFFLCRVHLEKLLILNNFLHRQPIKITLALKPKLPQLLHNQTIMNPHQEPSSIGSLPQSVVFLAKTKSKHTLNKNILFQRRKGWQPILTDANFSTCNKGMDPKESKDTEILC